MLAGAAGMELLLLVVAANEGARPQTIEHLQILQYLNVQRTLVVLTKRDLLSAEELDFAREEIGESLRGTIAADAPQFAVSTVTGEGLDELRAAIHDALAALPGRKPEAPVFLPIDRVFALPGHGTIVTGTLMQGRIAIGDELSLTPAAKSLRVRNLHVFGEHRDSVDGGARVAVNIPAAERSEISRGAVLASPQFEAAATFEVRFRPLAGALGMLRRRTPVRAYLGSAEIFGTLAFETVPVGVEEISARLHLRRPAVVFPGEAYVVRRLSPKDLLGGGKIVGAGTVARSASPSDDANDDAAEDVDDATPTIAALRAAGLSGATPAQIGAIVNAREEVALGALESLVERGRALRLAKPAAYLEGEVASGALARIVAQLETNERDRSWMLGTTSLALSRALDIPEPTLLRLLAAFVDDGSLAHRAGYYATPGYVPSLTPEQRVFFERALARNPSEPLVPTPLKEFLASVKAASAPGLSQALDTLLGSGALVKVGDELYDGEQIAAIRKQLEGALRNGNSLTMAQFRDLVGTTRKYAVPLLEWFDAAGVTIRSGDVRVLRERAKT
jgi:selenocysteine-specific elongation factor